MPAFSKSRKTGFASVNRYLTMPLPPLKDIVLINYKYRYPEIRCSLYRIYLLH